MAVTQVLGIVGSPRHDGNTEILVDEVLRGAQEAGASVQKVFLSDLDITPCNACDGCVDTGECITDDAMEDLFPRMWQSQVWVLGTPVYWWGPSAQFKTFVDRWYAKVHRREDKALFKGRRVILVVPMGDDDPATPRNVVGMMTDALKYLHAELFATVLALGAGDRGDVNKLPDVLTAAYGAGRAAVQADAGGTACGQ